MATLTGLIATLYEALDTVSREKVGFVPAVRRDTDVARAGLNQTVTFPIVPQGSLEDITPGQLPADSGSQTIGNDSITLSKSKAYPILWTGEETRILNNSDKPMYRNILRDQFSQAFRTFTNAMDADLASLYSKASRAAGTAGTTPFGTANDLSDFADSRRILEDNGAPTSDLQMVLGSAAIGNLRGVQSVLFKVNEAGTEELLRNGALGNVEGFMIHNSHEVDAHTQGTASSATTDNSGYSIGDTEITLASAGTGTIVAGDVITFAGDDNQYVVVSGDTDVSDGGTITLAEPGLRQAIAASTTAITVVDDYAANMAFDRNAIVLATRMPAMPEGGDSADDQMTITDPITGVSFDVRMYRQYHQVKIEVGLVWGYKMIKPEHTALLIG